MEVSVRNIINIFTIIDGKIRLLLNDDDFIIINCLDNFDVVNENYIKMNLNIENLNLRQCYTFSEKKDKKLELTVLYIDIINSDSIKLNGKFKFVNIDLFEKDNPYIKKSLEYLRRNIVLNSTIKKLYPEEFVLPEIQKVYESVLNKKYDRRNFRKRLIKLDVIEDLDKISSNKNGRPAKLYKFKSITDDKTLF